MTHLIDKDALVAKIERRKEKCELFYNIALSNNAKFAKVAIEEQKKQFDSFMEYINTLEVKEVDLEKEAERFVQTKEFAECEGSPVMVLAKHFFELGIKAQKGEL